MTRHSVNILTILTIVLLKGSFAIYSDCNKTDSPITCHGARAVKTIIERTVYGRNVQAPLKLFPGIEIVESTDKNVTESKEWDGRSATDKYGYLARIAKYLQGHDMKIKFSDLMKKEDLNEILTGTLKDIDEVQDSVGEGRGKKDKGSGDGGMKGALLMGAMFAKTLGALGIGAVGALAAKALGVAVLALMLAAIIGVKKLSEHGGDEQPHVQYITAQEHHRRRRSIDQSLPYSGWVLGTGSNRVSS